MMSMHGGVSIEVHLVAFTFFLQHEQLYRFSPVNLSMSRNYFIQSFSVRQADDRLRGIDKVSEQFSV